MVDFIQVATGHVQAIREAGLSDRSPWKLILHAKTGRLAIASLRPENEIIIVNPYGKHRRVTHTLNGIQQPVQQMDLETRGS